VSTLNQDATGWLITDYPLSFSQNPVGFEKSFLKSGLTGLRPAFSYKSKAAGQAKLVSQKLKFWESLIVIKKMILPAASGVVLDPTANKHRPPSLASVLQVTQGSVRHRSGQCGLPQFVSIVHSSRFYSQSLV
jgi:hypothetical protein